MARVKTFVNGGSFYPTDLNGIQDDYDGRLQAIETTGKTWQPGDLKFTAKSAPDVGWLLCDGSAVSRVTYSALFNSIGTTWGTGDGSTTFTLPTFAGRMPLGAGTASGVNGATAHALGQYGGEETHLLLSAESGVKPHAHNATTTIAVRGNAPAATWQIQGTQGSQVIANAFAADITTTVAAATAQDAANAHNNLGPFAVVTFQIKT